MSKDPALLFYTSDFLSGTMTMTNDHVGMYIRLLCLQHQKGHLTEKDMYYICTTYVEDVFCKFKRDDAGLYYNERLEIEANRRRNYSNSRRNNVLQRYKPVSSACGKLSTYVEHMETETETITEDVNTKRSDHFESVWSSYPKRVGKKSAERHYLASVKTDTDRQDLEVALKNYLASERVSKGFIQNGSTWFNQWRDWIDFKEEVCPKCKGKGKYISTTGYDIICKCPAGQK